MNNREALTRRAELAKACFEAFTGTVYPGDENIGRHEVKRFRGRWESLSTEIVTLLRGDLYFLNPIGFAYYLPAFLINVLLHHDEVDTLVDGLVHRLSPLDSSERLLSPSDWKFRWLEEIASYLHPRQIECLLSILDEYHQLFPDLLWYSNDVMVLNSALEYWKAKLAEK